MASKKAANKFFNDWQVLSAKPETQQVKKQDNKIEEPYRIKRPGVYLSMFPSAEGEKYSFFIVPDKDGKSFIMTEVMTIKRFKFRNPKTNEDYFENLKIPMDPKELFDMSVVDKATKNPQDLTDEDKAVLANIKRHSDLVKRYKDLYWCKVDNVNLGYAPNAGKYNNRIKKEALTGFFGVPTKWKGTPNTERDFTVKFIQSRYAQFQDKFRTLLEQTAETHDELQPTWYEEYFSTTGGVKGVINVEMGNMKVGGKGATVKLVKLGKDAIEDRGVGVTGDINPEDLVHLQGPEHSLSPLHYYLGFDSRENLWQDMYVDRFEEAIADLEGHVAEVAAANKLDESEAPVAEETKASDKKPF